MIKPILSICMLLVGTQVWAQFKYVPQNISNAPNWAQLMYVDGANLYEVEDLRAQYFQSNPYHKDIHERNFQHWITQVGRLVDERGQVRSEDYWESRCTARGGNAIWEPIGPIETYNLGSEGGFPVSWQINAYCMDACENNSNIVVAGIEGGDLFKSTDKGLSWAASTEGLPVATPTAVRIAPSDCSTIYFVANGSLYKTTDGGTSWTDVYSVSGNIYEIEVHPTDPNVVIICGSAGVSKSTDGGNAFTYIYSETCWDVKYHPTNSSTVYLLKTNSSANKCEFFKSVDGGDSFAIQTNGWYSPAVVGEAEDIGAKLGLSAAAADQIYVALLGASKADDNGWISVYKSTNSGVNWTNPSGQDGGPYDETIQPNLASINPNGTGFHQGFYNFAVGVSQSDASRLWVGCLSLNLSTDGGANFERIGGYSVGPNNIGWIHPDVQDIVTVGNDVWVTTDGGINYSSDDLATHESRKYGIYNSTFWGFNQGWNQDIMVGGRYHNGNTGYFENYPEGDHLRLGGAESPTGYVNPLLERKVYFSDITDHYLPQNFSDSKVNTANMGLYPTEGYWTSESSEVEFDPRYAGHMYLGKENKIYKSTNEGAIFEVLDTWGVNSVVYELEVCRQSPERLYTVVRTSGSARMYYSVNGGDDWTISPVDPGNSGKMEISVDPANDDVVWGIEVNSSSVFRTTDGGTSWEDMYTSTLSGHQLREVIVQGGSDVVYIGTNTSVFYWDADATDWVDIGAGLPARMDVLEMRIFYKESKLRLCDKGKGIWEAGLVESSLPIAQPMALNDDVYCSRDTVQFDCYSILDHNGASWEWSFSPQPVHVSATNVRNPKVVLGTDGDFIASLTVTDGNGNTSTNEISVAVNSNCNVDTVPGMAMECYGSGGDYASTPDFGITTNNFTISAWIKPDGIQPDYTGIVMNNGTSGGINFRGGNNTLGYHWPGGTWWWDSGLIVPDGQWSYVALVVTPTDATVYLNGVGVTHSATLSPLDVTSMFMGSYQDWGGRNYTGKIDEVRVWNRSLSQDEIRELRHITLTNDIMNADYDLLAYYQFNETEGGILDRKGINHASLAGGAVRESSDGPFGKGDVDRISITTSGAHNFANCESSIHFTGSVPTPDGEVVLTRLHVLPNEVPSNAINYGDYFILNNYGNNLVFETESIFLKPHNFNVPPVNWTTTLFSRTENEHLNNWVNGCDAFSSSSLGFNFGISCVAEGWQLFPVSDQYVSTIENEEEPGFVIYPNPVVNNGVVLIENKFETEVRFSIYNAEGKLLRSENVAAKQTLEFSPKSAGGVYTYSIQGQDYIRNGKLVVVN